MTLSPAFIATGISIIGVLLATGGSWALIHYRLSKIEERQTESDRKSAAFELQSKKEHTEFFNTIHDIQIQSAQTLNEIREAIRSEFGNAIGKINSLLFEESGSTRYVLRNECERCKERCRRDLLDRIDELSKRIPK